MRRVPFRAVLNVVLLAALLAATLGCQPGAPATTAPPEPPKEVSLILAEGGPAEEDVQVVGIDVAAGTVNILNRGMPQLLDITKDSPPPKAGGAPAPAPGGAPKPGIPIPPPPMLGGGPGAGGIVVPPRPMRGAEASGANPAGLDAQIAASSPAGVGWTGGKLGQPGGGAVPPPMSREEQEILIEVRREMGSEDAPILPPTTLRQLINQENNPNPTPNPQSLPVPSL